MGGTLAVLGEEADVVDVDREIRELSDLLDDGVAHVHIPNLRAPRARREEEESLQGKQMSKAKGLYGLLRRSK